MIIKTITKVIKIETTITIVIVINKNVILVKVHKYICPDSCIPQIWSEMLHTL